MRRVTTTAVAAAACLMMAACSKAPESGDTGPDIGGRAAAGVAFSYAYSLVLPTADIADLQETHAAACERLGVDRCRITGLNYSVASSGAVRADLAMKVAAPIARTFGRQAVVTAEKAGALLDGATIGGTEVAAQASADAETATAATADRARIRAELRRHDLTDEARAELVRQDAALTTQARDARRDAAAARESLANTPVSFAYRSGRGSGLVNRVREAGDAAAASTAVTLTAVLWGVATLGPPLIVLLAGIVLWRRWGRAIWRRIAGPAAEPADDHGRW